MRLTKIYTRKGDDGTTGLASGDRVPKDDQQVDSYGEVDELNAAIGLAVALGVADDLRTILLRIQHELFNVGAELSMIGAPPDRRPPALLVENADVERLERECDALNAGLGPLENFILPGGTTGSAALHVARTICRRAERRTVALAHERAVPQVLLNYLNRLSDLLFIMARYENRARGVPDVLWGAK